MATTAEDSFNVFKPNLEPAVEADGAGATSESNIEMSQEETKESK